MVEELDDLADPAGSEAHFRQVMGRFCTGVGIVTGLDAGEPVGFTVQTFTSVSIDPPLVSFCPARTVTSWPRMRRAGTFCVNVLAEHQEALCRRFASRRADKFMGVGWRPAPATGAPLLEGGIAWIEGRTAAEHDAGDHTIVVGRVLDLGVGADGGPLLFFRGGFGRFLP